MWWDLYQARFWSISIWFQLRYCDTVHVIQPAVEHLHRHIDVHQSPSRCYCHLTSAEMNPSFFIDLFDVLASLAGEKLRCSRNVLWEMLRSLATQDDNRWILSLSLPIHFWLTFTLFYSLYGVSKMAPIKHPHAWTQYIDVLVERTMLAPHVWYQKSKTPQEGSGKHQKPLTLTRWRVFQTLPRRPLGIFISWNVPELSLIAHSIELKLSVWGQPPNPRGFRWRTVPYSTQIFDKQSTWSWHSINGFWVFQNITRAERNISGEIGRYTQVSGTAHSCPY